MRCWKVKRKISAYLDNHLADTDRREVRDHLAACLECSQDSDGILRTRMAVRTLTPKTPPPDLVVKLRVLASRERATGFDTQSRFRGWLSSAKVVLDNLMRPVALPAAGGLCAAVLLFMSLVSTFSRYYYPATGGDIPTVLSTAPAVKSVMPIGFYLGDAEVDLRIDEQGRIVNYSIVGGQGGERDVLRRCIENNLLFTQFTPATAFGVPISGTLRLSFRSSRIDVKG